MCTVCVVLYSVCVHKRIKSTYPGTYTINNNNKNVHCHAVTVAVSQSHRRPDCP